MEIIGLSGYARSGKDEAAKVLVEEFGFTRVAFADKLREVLYAPDPIVSESDMTVQDVIDNHGWEGYKETRYGPEIRRLIQRLGTDAGRNILGDQIWIKAALDGYPDQAKIVVTDCRFPNEAEAVRFRGGDVWRITREGVGPANDHASEISLDNYDFDVFIENDGTLEQFRQKVIGAGYWQVPEGTKV